MLQNASIALSTPVLLIIFKRQETTQCVFDVIRQVKPLRLYVAADGARPQKPDEVRQVEATRAIIAQVDWPCEVKTLFREENLGCGVAPSSAISWFFEQEEEGIILEDDCLPDPSFFWFCEELLEKHRHDTRVMQIAGVNPHNGWQRDLDYDYYFSEAGITWGWATWRRAWQLYDYSVHNFKEVTEKGYIESFFFHKEGKEWILNCLQEASKHLPTVSWWDFQWEFSKFIHSGLSIIPNTNLVKNIGFGSEATHTFDAISFGNAETQSIHFPLRHPPFMIRDSVSDERYFARHIRTGMPEKIKKYIKLFIPAQIWRRLKTIQYN